MFNNIPVVVAIWISHCSQHSNLTPPLEEHVHVPSQESKVYVMHACCMRVSGIDFACFYNFTDFPAGYNIKKSRGGGHLGFSILFRQISVST